LRKWFISYPDSRSAPLKRNYDVKAWSNSKSSAGKIGHTADQMTKKYQHSLTEIVQDAADKLSKVINQ